MRMPSLTLGLPCGTLPREGNQVLTLVSPPKTLGGSPGVFSLVCPPLSYFPSQVPALYNLPEGRTGEGGLFHPWRSAVYFPHVRGYRLDAEFRLGAPSLSMDQRRRATYFRGTPKPT
jgi:hypothetical protein